VGDKYAGDRAVAPVPQNRVPVVLRDKTMTDNG